LFSLALLNSVRTILSGFVWQDSFFELMAYDVLYARLTGKDNCHFLASL